MSPFEILGIPRTATLDEAEAAYRRLLYECHPDRHVQAGPGQIAWAEARTRELNAAMRAVRAKRRVLVGPAGERFGRNHGFHARVGGDWFGNPRRTPPRIHCVICGLTIDTVPEYRVHLVLDHALSSQARARAARGVPQWLAWVPAPMFWSLVVLLLYSAALFAVLGDSGVAVAGMWLGVFAYLLFLPMAYRAERYRRRL